MKISSETVLICENCKKSFIFNTGYGSQGRWCSRSCCAKYNATHNTYYGSLAQKENIAKARKNIIRNVDNNPCYCQYCGKECKNQNSLRNHERQCKKNPNQQISPFVEYNKKVKEGKIEKPFLNKAHKAKILNLSYQNPLKGRKLPDDVKKKISQGVKKWCEENPEKQTFSRLRHNEGWISYPEKYFREVFKNNFLFYIPEYKVGRYSLDFAWPDKKIYLEIDGGQHQRDWIRAHDIERDQNLKDLGWVLVDRVRWWEFNRLNREDREVFIKNLLEKINSF